MISKHSNASKWFFVCTTRSVMALWDRYWHTFCTGPPGFCAKHNMIYYSQEGKFSSENTDSLKLNIKSHPPALASSLWEIIALIWPGQLSTPNPDPAAGLSIWGSAGDKNQVWVSGSCYFTINWNVYEIKQPLKDWKERLVLQWSPQQWLQPITVGCSRTDKIHPSGANILRLGLV